MGYINENMRERDAERRRDRKRAVMLCAFFALYFFWMEVTVMLSCYGSVLGWGIAYTLFFSVVFGIVAGLLSSFWGKTANRIVSLVLAFAAFLIFGTQAVYFTIFKTFTTIDSATRAGDVLGEFSNEALAGILASALPLLILLLPFVLLAVFGGRFTPRGRLSLKPAALLLAAAVILQAACTLAVSLNRSGVMSYSYVYGETFSPELSVPRFGVLTTLRLEIRNKLKGTGEAADNVPADGDGEPAPDIPDPVPAEPAEEPAEEPEPPKTYAPNVMEIDFDSLIAGETDAVIADMHEYFSTRAPTVQNEYTGMFEGKNLIWIVGEAFSTLAIDEAHTPTLYKLSRSGFVFSNFYNPVWGVSTSDGEYVTLNSLIPKSGVWSFKTSANNLMPFGFGTMFSDLGYTARAYHNHTYTYYGRDKSHPNLGYDYKGLGNGLDVKKQWPESDVEMMEKSLPEFIGDERFHTYYLTVSGHMNYNFNGNMMCYKHKADVKDMLDAGYSEGASAYIACQMELDQAMEYLISELDKAGKLEDTVIVLSGDHYPYGLTAGEMEELAGHEIEENFEIYRSTLIVWNSEMETRQVDKYCSSLDIMPTLANLFGLSYDSRLLMGSDILSDAPPLVIFNNRSFITDAGRYNSVTDTFTPNAGAEVNDGYAASMLQIVNDKFAYSAAVLENDYYARVFPEKAGGGEP